MERTREQKRKMKESSSGEERFKEGSKRDERNNRDGRGRKEWKEGKGGR